MRNTLNILIIFFLSSCAGGIQHLPETKYPGITPTNFCDLIKVKGQRVYTRGSFSGVDEYWSFSSVGKQCNDTLNIELDLDTNWDEWKNEDKKKIQLVYDEYWNKYLIIDAIGVFETRGKHGHLGTNNAKFTVQELVNVQLVKKKQR